MKRHIAVLLFAFFALAGSLLYAQEVGSPPPTSLIFTGADPSGACTSTNLSMEWSTATLTLWYCSGTPGTWTKFDGTITLSQGGCGTSLAATGPGWLRQATTGATCTVLSYIPVSSLGAASANLFVDNAAWNIDFTGSGWWGFPKVGIGTAFVPGAPSGAFVVANGSAAIYDPSSLGAELGTSDTSCTNWTLGAGWACAGGLLSHTAGNTATAEYVPPSTWFTAGNYVHLVFSISSSLAGYVTPAVGGVSVSNTSAIVHTGTYFYDVATTTTGHLIFTPTTNFDGAIGATQGAGGLSLKQITGGNLHVAGPATFDSSVTIGAGGSASSVACWKSDGITLGHATVAEITAGTCH